MKNILLLIVLIFTTSSTLAARIDATGKIGDIRYHVDEGVLAPDWNKVVWFQLINSN